MPKLLILFALLFASTTLHAIETITPEMKKEILERCRNQMKDYGTSLVKACVDQDLDAAEKLTNYPRDKSTSEIVSRCEQTMSNHGWNLVKACVDQDMEANKELGKLEQKYSKIVASCTRRMKNYGWNLVKACVDQDIEAEEALKNF